MASRKQKLRGNTRNTTKKSSDECLSDDILAPNSDTECEPLSKRRKQIEEIAQFVRDGGELALISTTLRGPIVNNPWARRKMPSRGKNAEKGAAKKVEEVRPKKTKTTSKSNPVKNSKVDRYFPAQKNSQEREVSLKKKIEKYAREKEDPIISDDNTAKEEILCENIDRHVSKENSPEPLQAVPRKIDFDNIPTSTDIPSQNFPSLRLLSPPRIVAQPRQTASESISSTSNQVSSGSVPADGNIGLFDAPTPERPSPQKKVIPKPTPAQIISIRDLLSDESQEKPVSEPAEPSDEGLYDAPTPPQNKSPIRNEASAPVSPIHTNPPLQEERTPIQEESSNTILPASLTNRAPSFSPVKSSPLKILNDNEMNIRPISLSPEDDQKLTSHFPKKSLTTPATPRPSPPPTTQVLLAQANESFNAIITPLLPPATVGPRPSSTKLPNGLTPFRELNASPAPESYRLSYQESPLTYSPLLKGEETLWGEVKSLLGKWDLDEEVGKYRDEIAREKEGSEGFVVGV